MARRGERPPEELDPEQLSHEDLVALMWRKGDLLWKLDPHQREVYDAFEEWNQRRLTPEYEEAVIVSGATLDDVWVEEIGRRFGKTAKWIILLAQIAIRRPGATLMYGTAYNKDIGEIIVPLARQLLDDGPDDVRPVYRTARQESNQGLFFPNGSSIKLVGLDEHPDAARGRFSDGIVLSEAGFMRGLEDLVRAVLIPQFQRRPWAFLALESSTPKQANHDFNRIFVADAKLRNAYIKRTIDDNKAITEREKERHIRQAGGRGHAVADREYFCKQTRDPHDMVIPEFDRAKHVREHQRPEYGCAIAAADPGMRDLFGAVWAYWDFHAAKLVVERSWAAKNAATRRVAAVFAAIELQLWGTPPPLRMSRVPLRGSQDGIEAMGWYDLLRGEPEQFMAGRLFELCQAKRSERPKEEWTIGYPAGRFVYWNGKHYAPNPMRRVSDIEIRMLADVQLEFGFEFEPVATEDVEVGINLVRDWFAADRITILPGAGPVIAHVEDAIWNEKRTDWERNKDQGHFDCLSALIFAVRSADQLRARRPFPENYIDRHDPRLGIMPWHTPNGQFGQNSADIRSLVTNLDNRRPWR